MMALEPPLRRTRRPPQLAHKLAVERPQLLLALRSPAGVRQGTPCGTIEGLDRW
jgi:hypothetical protein